MEPGLSSAGRSGACTAPLWLWIVFGVPIIVLALLLLFIRRPWLELVSVTLGVVAAVATITTAVGFAAYGGAAEARIVEGATRCSIVGGALFFADVFDTGRRAPIRPFDSPLKRGAGSSPSRQNRP
jgi:hypothetical protein